MPILFKSDMKLAHHHFILMPLAVAIVLSLLLSAITSPLLDHYPALDDFSYTTLANNLITQHTFTGAYSKEKIIDYQQQGMFFAPLYPAFVALVAMINDDTKTVINCIANQKHNTSSISSNCPLDQLNFLQLVQSVLAGLSAFFIFLSVWFLTKSQHVAWLSMIISSLCLVFQKFAYLVLTENLVLVLFFAFLASYTFCLTRNTSRWLYVLSGGLIGLLILTRPAYLYMLYGLIPVCFLYAYFYQKTPLQTAFQQCLVLGLAALVVLLPWLGRNFYYFDTWAITQGYAPLILVQRLSFNAMTFYEWVASFFCWLPRIGGDICRALFDEQTTLNLVHNESKSYYQLF